MTNASVDFNKVIGKLQARLGEALTLIAMLETRIEDLLEEVSVKDIKDEDNANPFEH